jgi:hypothetical protein
MFSDSNEPGSGAGPDCGPPQARLQALRSQPPCRFCRCPVSDAERRAGDFLGETLRCRSCLEGAVIAMPHARRLFAPVLTWVRSQGLSLPRPGPRLLLCNEERLSRLGNRPAWNGELGATWSRLRAWQPTGIVLLWGLPAAVFQGVAVYELGRYWLRSHHPTGLPPWFERGLCQLLVRRHGRHRLLQHLGRSGRFLMDLGPGNLTAEGPSLRRVRELVSREGLSRVAAGVEGRGSRANWRNWGLSDETGMLRPDD